MSNFTQIAVQYGCILAQLWYGCRHEATGNHNVPISHGYKCDIAFIQQFDGTSVSIHIKQQWSVFQKPSFVQNSFLPPWIQITSWQVNSCLIGKRHFRTSNEGMLSCFIESLLYHRIKSWLFYGEYSIMRESWTERVWLPASDTAFILQLNLIFTIKHEFECPLRKRYLCRTLLSSVKGDFHWQRCCSLHLLTASYK